MHQPLGGAQPWGFWWKTYLHPWDLKQTYRVLLTMHISDIEFCNRWSWALGNVEDSDIQPWLVVGILIPFFCHNPLGLPILPILGHHIFQSLPMHKVRGISSDISDFTLYSLPDLIISALFLASPKKYLLIHHTVTEKNYHNTISNYSACFWIFLSCRVSHIFRMSQRGEIGVFKDSTGLINFQIDSIEIISMIGWTSGFW